MTCPFRTLHASAATSRNAADRGLGLALALGGFAATWAFFAGFILFLGGFPDRSEPWLDFIDQEPGGHAWSPHPWAPVVNLALIAAFGFQHSGMARSSFKTFLTKFVPQALERSIYVMAAALAGFALIVLWQPMPAVVWHIDGKIASTLIWTGFAAGWLMLLGAALSIDILQLLGLRQAWAWYTRRPLPLLQLKTGFLYAYLSHPMYVGVFLGLWMTPHMTAGHLLLAIGLTYYMLLGKMFEERDLECRFGPAYVRWREGCASGARARR